jgi:hypothetical protein
VNQFLAIVTFINNLLPLIEQTIVAAEKLCPTGSQGAAKLAMVQTVVTEAISLESNLPVIAAQAGPLITAAVNSMVALKKAAGTMQTTTLAPTMSPAQ